MALSPAHAGNRPVCVAGRRGQFALAAIQGQAALVTTSSDPKDPATYEAHQLAEYPELAIAKTADPAATWSCGSNGKGWRLPQPTNGKVSNALVAMVVVPD